MLGRHGKTTMELVFIVRTSKRDQRSQTYKKRRPSRQSASEHFSGFQKIWLRGSGSAEELKDWSSLYEPKVIMPRWLCHSMKPIKAYHVRTKNRANLTTERQVSSWENSHFNNLRHWEKNIYMVFGPPYGWYTGNFLYILDIGRKQLQVIWQVLGTKRWEYKWIEAI